MIVDEPASDEEEEKREQSRLWEERKTFERLLDGETDRVDFSGAPRGSSHLGLKLDKEIARLLIEFSRLSLSPSQICPIPASARLLSAAAAPTERLITPALWSLTERGHKGDYHGELPGR